MAWVQELVLESDLVLDEEWGLAWVDEWGQALAREWEMALVRELVQELGEE